MTLTVPGADVEPAENPDDDDHADGQLVHHSYLRASMGLRAAARLAG